MGPSQHSGKQGFPLRVSSGFSSQSVALCRVSNAQVGTVGGTRPRTSNDSREREDGVWKLVFHVRVWISNVPFCGGLICGGSFRKCVRGYRAIIHKRVPPPLIFFL